MKVFSTKEFEEKLLKIDPESKKDIYDFINNISNFNKIEYILKLSEEIDAVNFFKVSNFIIFFSYTNDKVVLYDLNKRTITDQEVAEEVLIRYIERSRDAQNVKVLECSEDENNWVFKISFQSENGYIEGKWGIDKRRGTVTNQLDIEPKEIVLNVIEHETYSEYSIANVELQNNTKNLTIKHEIIESFIGATFGKYYENIIEMLTNKLIKELCEIGYNKYRVLRLPDNFEVLAGNFNCNG